MTLTLDQAKEQIAKENGFQSWVSIEKVCERNAYNRYLNSALYLVLSSKDKEIAELKSVIDGFQNSQHDLLKEKQLWVDECKELRVLLSKMHDIKDQNNYLKKEVDENTILYNDAIEANDRLKKALETSTRNYDDQSLKVNRQAKHIEVLQAELYEINKSLKNCKDGNLLILNEKIEAVQELFETKSELSNLMEEVKDLRMQLIKKDEKINDLGDCLTLGRRYLMEVDPIDLSVESCLQAFGYNKNGFKN